MIIEFSAFWAGLAACIPVGQFIDRNAPVERKEAFAKALFQQRPSVDPELESSTMRAVLSFYFRGDRLHWPFVLLVALAFSSIFTLCFAFIILLGADPTSLSVRGIVLAIAWSFIFFPFTLPFDVFSLWISKQIFVARSHRSPLIYVWMLVDAAVSSFLPLVIGYLGFAISSALSIGGNAPDFVMASFLISICLIISGLRGAFHTVVGFMICMGGLLIRLATILLRGLHIIGYETGSSKHPYTFSLMAFYITAFIATVLLWPLI